MVRRRRWEWRVGYWKRCAGAAGEYLAPNQNWSEVTREKPGRNGDGETTERKAGQEGSRGFKRRRGDKDCVWYQNSCQKHLGTETESNEDYGMEETLVEMVTSVDKDTVSTVRMAANTAPLTADAADIGSTTGTAAADVGSTTETTAAAGSRAAISPDAAPPTVILSRGGTRGNDLGSYDLLKMPQLKRARLRRHTRGAFSCAVRGRSRCTAHLPTLASPSTSCLGRISGTFRSQDSASLLEKTQTLSTREAEALSRGALPSAAAASTEQPEVTEQATSTSYRLGNTGGAMTSAASAAGSFLPHSLGADRVSDSIKSLFPSSSTASGAASAGHDEYRGSPPDLLSRRQATSRRSHAGAMPQSGAEAPRTR
uniref:Uncharacterized protein n=1 Tax=Oryza glumipatula TaxID=40148 RepID=A0A0D9ZVA9_9ORYZ